MKKKLFGELYEYFKMQLLAQTDDILEVSKGVKLVY